MAAAPVGIVDEVNEGIDFIELPLIDLRHFCGDELRLVAQFSGHFPDASFSDIVVPKIDRSCFNESAGSRRQTWSNRASGSSKHSNRSRLGSSATTSAAVIQRTSIGSRTTTVQSRTTRELIMPYAGTRFRNGTTVATLTSNGKVTGKSSARQVDREGAITRGVTDVAVAEKRATNGEIQGPVGGVAGIVREPLSRKRLRQPIQAVGDGEESEEEIGRTRNGKRIKSSAASRNFGVGLLVGAKRGSGSLFSTRKPERAQKRRIRDSDMMDRLASMKGTWASSERTRKIVDASGFPVGWTVRVGLRYKYGRTLFEYRDWRSPDGTLWSSFRDASAFLLSSIAHDSTSKIVVPVKPGGGTVGDEGFSSPKKGNTTERVGKGNVQGGFCSYRVPRADWDQAAGGCGNVNETPNWTLAGTGLEIVTYVDKLQAESRHSELLNKLQTQERGQSSRLLENHSCRDLITKTEDSSRSADLKGSPRIAGKIPNFALPASGVDELQAEGGHREILSKEQTQESGQSQCLLERHRCGNNTIITEDSSKNTDLKELPRISYHESTSHRRESSINLGHSKTKEGEMCSRLTPSNDTGHKCLSCGMMFSTLLKLRGHVRRAKKKRRINCDVCRRHFSSTALFLSHRVQMGHPRVTKSASDSRRFQAKGLERVSRARGPKISKIVLALPCDGSFGIGGDVEQACVASKSSSKPTENFSARDVLKVAHKEVKQDALKNGDLSGVFECETCNKVFYRRSQYWGHQSVHAKERKKALKLGALSESLSNRPLDRSVGPESNLSMVVVKENSGYEAGNKYAVGNLLWRLLDDSLPLKGPNHELDKFQDDSVRPPGHQSKEQAAGGILKFRFGTRTPEEW